MSNDDKLLRIYLQDHLAGATAGAARAHRLAEVEADAKSDDAADLAAFARDVEEDRTALLSVMKAAGVVPNVFKTGVASVGEKVGALKPNGYAVRRSPLSTIVELEAMQMAVRGKRSLWETVQLAVPELPGSGVDIAALVDRAEHQLTTLARLHADRARSVFAPQR